MIVVTRLNGSRFAINPDLIERVQESPDTTILMVDGAQYIVTETMDALIDLIADYRARVVSLAARFDATTDEIHRSTPLHRAESSGDAEKPPNHSRTT